MGQNYILALAAGIGFAAGLRSMTAPAAVSWAAHLGRLKLSGTALGFMSDAAAAGIWSLLAAAEFVVDLLPQAPNRTEPASLAVRILTGGLTGACRCASEGRPAVAGAVLGAVGAVVGAFAGFHGRTRLARRFEGKGTAIAIAEDFVAVGLACAIVFLG